MMLKQARHAILPALALAAWGVTFWTAADGLDNDDVIPTGVAVVLSIWSLLAYQYRKFWRETRKAKFENALASIAEGVRAEMHGRAGGDGQPAPGPRKGS